MSVESVTQRNERGHFVAGNTEGKKHKLKDSDKALRKATRREVYKCAHSLTLPYGELMDLAKDPKKCSALLFATAKSIQKHDMKWVQYLLDQAIDKATQRIENVGESGLIQINVDKDDLGL